MTTEPSDASLWTSSPGPLVLVVPEHRSLQEILEPVTTLADARGFALVLLRPVVVPEQTPLDAVDDDQLEAHRRDVASLEASARELGSDTEIRSKVYVGRRHASVVGNAVEELGAVGAVLPGLFPTGPEEVLTASDLEDVMEAVQAPTIVYREPTAPRKLDAVLAAIAGGPHSAAVTTWAARWAATHGASLDLVHVVEPGSPQERGREVLQAARERVVQAGVEAQSRLLEAEDVVDALAKQLDERDALFVGAPTRNRLQHLLYGSTSRRLEQDAPAWTFTVHAGR